MIPIDGEADAIAWSAARLLALQGIPGEADRLAAAILGPAKGARYLLAGHPPRMEHRHDGPRPPAQPNDPA